MEDAADWEGVGQEIADLDGHFGGGGAAEAIAISFLSETLPNSSITDASKEALIGQCILINYRAPGKTEFSKSYIFEAIFATPRIVGGSKSLLNNYINAEGEFEVNVLGRKFALTGVCYNQQNGITSVCAHASIRMVMRTLFPGRPAMSCGEVDARIGRNACPDGLYANEIADVMGSFDDVSVDLVNCDGLTAAEYISILTAATDSGDMALLVFKTGTKRSLEAADGNGFRRRATAIWRSIASFARLLLLMVPAGLRSSGQQVPANHVVVVFGHTRNSDEWHPQAIPAYSGAKSATFCPSSSWVDHFVIHDDNFGPYFTLSSRVLEVDPTVRPKTILIVRRQPSDAIARSRKPASMRGLDVRAHEAEQSASLAFSYVRPFVVSMSNNLWFELVTGRPRTYVTRPVMVSRNEYVDHLTKVRAHDGSLVEAGGLAALEQLPDIFWMVEFTLADLFTGNRSKLGEVLIKADWSDEIESDRRNLVLAIRLPCILLTSEASGAAMEVRPFPIASHCDIYMRRPHNHQW
jgi:hypothetical protein